jgi:3-hydroxybutyryl-CoA dehydratase
VNKYILKELYEGLTHEFEVLITEQHMHQFLNISGDINPMHIDGEFARLRQMNGRVVYGMLTSSFYSTLIGVYLPGKYALLHSIDIQFLKPVYIGDMLKITGEISEVNKTFNQVSIKAAITNQNNVKVSRAKIKAGVLE